MNVCICLTYICICIDIHTYTYICIHIHIHFLFRDWRHKVKRRFLYVSALAEEFIFITSKERVNGIFFSSVFQNNLLYAKGQKLEIQMLSKAKPCHPWCPIINAHLLCSYLDKNWHPPFYTTLFDAGSRILQITFLLCLLIPYHFPQ